jgi:hypothetical protein
VECPFIRLGNIFMALAAKGRIFGRPKDQTVVSIFLIFRLVVALMAGGAGFGKMGVQFKSGFTDHVPLVHLFRPDRRKDSCSPFSFFGIEFNFGRCVEGFYFALIGVACDAGGLFLRNNNGKGTYNEHERKWGYFKYNGQRFTLGSSWI